jgi:hypothetical protein
MPTLVTTKILFCDEFLSIGDKNKRGLEIKSEFKIETMYIYYIAI